jgi:hypothetical protein
MSWWDDMAFQIFTDTISGILIITASLYLTEYIKKIPIGHDVHNGHDNGVSGRKNIDDAYVDDVGYYLLLPLYLSLYK